MNRKTGKGVGSDPTASCGRPAVLVTPGPDVARAPTSVAQRESGFDFVSRKTPYNGRARGGRGYRVLVGRRLSPSRRPVAIAKLMRFATSGSFALRVPPGSRSLLGEADVWP